MSWIILYRRSLRLKFNNPTAKSVWMTVISFVDEDGKCWPAIESRYPGKMSLASVSELSPRVISKWLNHFVRIGVISRERGPRGSYYQLDLAEAERAFGSESPAPESWTPDSDSSKQPKPIINKNSGDEFQVLVSLLGEQRSADLLEIREAKRAPNTPGALRALIHVIEAHRTVGADVELLIDTCIRHGWASPKVPQKTASVASPSEVGGKKPKVGLRLSSAETLGKLKAIDSERSRNRRDLLAQRFPKNTHIRAAVFDGEAPGLQIFCSSPVQRQPLEDLRESIIRELARHGEEFGWATVEVYAPRALAVSSLARSDLSAPWE